MLRNRVPGARAGITYRTLERIVEFHQAVPTKVTRAEFNSTRWLLRPTGDSFERSGGRRVALGIRRLIVGPVRRLANPRGHGSHLLNILVPLHPCGFKHAMLGDGELRVFINDSVCQVICE